MTVVTLPQRIVRKRTKGWRMPERAMYVGRPTVYGNPFPLNGDWITWTAVALGYRGDALGRRDASVALYRSWITEQPVVAGPHANDEGGGAIEYSSGEIVATANVARGFAALGAALVEQPERRVAPASVAPLRGHDLACWCPVGLPCHADVLIELANRGADLAGQGDTQ